jgi:hypothetical protein
MASNITCCQVRIISEDNKKVPVLYFVLRRISNRSAVQHTSEPLNSDTLFFKSISTQIITLAYQYAATAYQYADD